MTDDFEKRATQAAESYATGDHSVSFADTHDMAAFIEGTMWARAEMQAEYAETAKQQWRKLKAELADAKGELIGKATIESNFHNVQADRERLNAQLADYEKFVRCECDWLGRLGAKLPCKACEVLAKYKGNK